MKASWTQCFVDLIFLNKIETGVISNVRFSISQILFDCFYYLLFVCDFAVERSRTCLA